jgi:(1->4)-alpha-D-glucan 1-alpha-D-glucosylmutase
MAKGIEDTAFYRHVPLVSINEVGCEPEHPATSVAEFHRQNSFRQACWPDSLVATTTHDTKRTEDTRARIDVLSEVPGLWRSAVQRWARLNKRHLQEVEGEPAPSRNDEWLFYETLIGVWPPETPDESERAALIARLQQYMEKAIHEAKLRTSWINPSPQYDAAVREFVASALSPKSTRFVNDLQAFIAAILPGGLYSALSQVLLKLCSPGIPDIYQGQELWDFSLVDPDNRRPVDYDRRRWLLSEIDQHSGEDSRAAFAARLAQTPRDDRLKLLVTATALRFRRDWPSLADCEYVPLEVQGSCAEHVVAFAWKAKSQRAVVVAPRLIHTLTSAAAVSVPCGPDVWQDTALNLENIPDRLWQERMTGRKIEVSDGRLPLATLLGDFPVALATTLDTPST